MQSAVRRRGTGPPERSVSSTATIKAGIGPFLDRRQRERRTFVARRPFPTRGDKAVLAGHNSASSAMRASARLIGALDRMDSTVPCGLRGPSGSSLNGQPAHHHARRSPQRSLPLALATFSW